MMSVYDMYLVISDICEQDIGEYGLTVAMADDKTMAKSMMLTGAYSTETSNVFHFV